MSATNVYAPGIIIDDTDDVIPEPELRKCSCLLIASLLKLF